jgi:hypothetical protein
MVFNYKQRMDLIIEQIKRSGIKNMTDYFEFEYIGDDMQVSYYKPATRQYTTKIGHKIIRQITFENTKTAEGIDCYSRLFRFGKSDYLNYVTYLAYYNDFVCDRCDNNFQGNRYKCIKCFDVDLCYKCHFITKKKCPSCQTDKLFKYSQDCIFPKCSKITI